MSKKKKPTSAAIVPTPLAAVAVPADLLTDVRTMIDQARESTARAVNSAWCCSPGASAPASARKC